MSRRVTRREFFRDGIAAFTISFAAPKFLVDIARAQGAVSRNLVVLQLAGGNDSLSMVVPYTDPFYYSRRPNIAVPAAQVLQIGTDSSKKALGLHPRLTGLQTIFNDGKLALIQRAGYANSSRSHFQGTDIWGSADPSNPSGLGWIGRYLDSLPQPQDPLAGWNTSGSTLRALQGAEVAVPSITNPTTYSFASPNTGAEAINERNAAIRLASAAGPDRPQVAFVNTSAMDAFATLDRVASVVPYKGTVTYPNNGFGAALKTVAGSIAMGIGTRVYWVQTGGFDLHSGLGDAGGGAYATLMSTLGDGVLAFYNDLKNQGLLDSTLIVQFFEFGRRTTENGSKGTDHGAGAIMMAMGGAVRGGIYGTAADLNPRPDNPTLENSGGDVTYETDFRSVYAKVLDGWMGTNSTTILGGDFRAAAPAFL